MQTEMLVVKESLMFRNKRFCDGLRIGTFWVTVRMDMFFRFLDIQLRPHSNEEIL